MHLLFNQQQIDYKYVLTNLFRSNNVQQAINTERLFKAFLLKHKQALRKSDIHKINFDFYYLLNKKLGIIIKITQIEIYLKQKS